MNTVELHSVCHAICITQLTQTHLLASRGQTPWPGKASGTSSSSSPLCVPVLFFPYLYYPSGDVNAGYLWVINPFQQSPSQMDWPFISERAEIKLLLLMGIVSIDLHVSPLCSEGPPQTITERWRYNCSQEVHAAAVRFNCLRYPTGTELRGAFILTGGVCRLDFKEDRLKDLDWDISKILATSFGLVWEA